MEVETIVLKQRTKFIISLKKMGIFRKTPENGCFMGVK